MKLMAYHRKNRSKEEAEYYRKLGEAINKHRISNGLTRLDVAIDLGMPNSSQIAKYEDGRTIPSLYVLHKIAKALDVDINQLIPEL
jgi:transcriptional regulator with XRE-family HTH domain